MEFTLTPARGIKFARDEVDLPDLLDRDDVFELVDVRESRGQDKIASHPL